MNNKQRKSNTKEFYYKLLRDKNTYISLFVKNIAKQLQALERFSVEKYMKNNNFMSDV